MKLKAVIVDDEPKVFIVIKDHCKNSSLVDIVGTFTDPEEFLKVAPTIDFDVALLDIQMDKMLGTQVAREINDKAVIYITGAFNYLKDAIKTPYADVVLKPIKKDFLEIALKKAQLMIEAREEKSQNNAEYKYFNVAGSKAKDGNKAQVSIKLSDIFLVETDELNKEYRHIYLRNGNRNTVTDAPLEELLKIVPGLKRANKSELVSKEAVAHIINNRIIVLNGIIENGKPREVKLSRFYKKSFLKQN